MKQKSLIDYLDENLDQIDFDGALEWKWNKKNRSFILGMEFYIENNSNREIIDSNDMKSVEPIIDFYDEILLFDKTKEIKFNKDDFLACLSFNGKKGWTKGKADAFLDVLQDTLDNGESDLMDFVNDEKIETFNLNWNMDEFKKQLEKNDDDNEILPYPKF